MLRAWDFSSWLTEIVRSLTEMLSLAISAEEDTLSLCKWKSGSETALKAGEEVSKDYYIVVYYGLPEKDVAEKCGVPAS